jgi:hypothetical protein
MDFVIDRADTPVKPEPMRMSILLAGIQEMPNLLNVFAAGSHSHVGRGCLGHGRHHAGFPNSND